MPEQKSVKKKPKRMILSQVMQPGKYNWPFYDSYTPAVQMKDDDKLIVRKGIKQKYFPNQKQLFNEKALLDRKRGIKNIEKQYITRLRSTKGRSTRSLLQSLSPKEGSQVINVDDLRLDLLMIKNKEASGTIESVFFGGQEAKGKDYTDYHYQRKLNPKRDEHARKSLPEPIPIDPGFVEDNSYTIDVKTGKRMSDAKRLREE